MDGYSVELERQMSRTYYSVNERDGRRNLQKKRTAEELILRQHPDRNSKFKKIDELKQMYLNAGKSVISIDAKKKKLLGDFFRDGVADGIKPTIINDHDFPSASNAKEIPHGIYDLGINEAVVGLTSSHDSWEFACESV